MSLSQLVNSDDDENDMLKIIVLSGFDRLPRKFHEQNFGTSLHSGRTIRDLTLKPYSHVSAKREFSWLRLYNEEAFY